MRDETWEVQLATAEPFLLFYIPVRHADPIAIGFISAPFVVFVCNEETLIHPSDQPGGSSG